VCCAACARTRGLPLGRTWKMPRQGTACVSLRRCCRGPRPAVGLQMAHTALSNMMGRAQRPPFSVAPQFQDQHSMVATSGPFCTMIQNSKLTAFVNFIAEHSLPHSHLCLLRMTILEMFERPALVVGAEVYYQCSVNVVCAKRRERYIPPLFRQR
jgi:hypothetical protein